MSGALHMYAIDLDRDAVVGLVSDVTKRLTGSGVSDEDQKQLRSQLGQLTFSGTISFDPADAHVSATHLIVSQSGTELAKIDSITQQKSVNITVNSSKEQAAFTLAATTTDARDDLKVTVSQ